MKILIHNGHLLDPATGFDAKADLAIADGKLVAMGQVSKDFHADKQIDASVASQLNRMKQELTK
jgi:dihydroorotase